MPKNRPKRRQAPRERPYVSNLELREALAEKLSERVLRDRFAWGKDRLRRLWDQSLDYLHDMDEGLITAREMLDTLEREDGIRITWSARAEK